MTDVQIAAIPAEWRWRKCLIGIGLSCHERAVDGTANLALAITVPYRTKSVAGNQIEPQRKRPSVCMCKRAFVAVIGGA